METRHQNILKMWGNSNVHLSFWNTALETVSQWDGFGLLRKATIAVGNVCGKNEQQNRLMAAKSKGHNVT